MDAKSTGIGLFGSEDTALSITLDEEHGELICIID